MPLLKRRHNFKTDNGDKQMPYLLALTCLLTFSYASSADSNPNTTSKMVPLADGHAPNLVMGDHTHSRGEWMLSYKYMRMEMKGNKINSNNISPETITTRIPNRFFSLPGQPPTLRVVPTEMSMDMHMFGLMYAPSNQLTLMAMSNYQEKEMDHITFAGGAGTVQRGNFKTRTNGIGDLRLTGLVSLFKNSSSRGIIGLGFSLPTGSTSKKDAILAPTGATPTVRLPYSMQNGSGTIDFLPSLTYSGRSSKVGWGAQWSGQLRTQKNNGWNLGDRHDLTGWISYRWISKLSGSIRLKYESFEKLEGIDPNILLPVQTADPDNYGGDKVKLLLGLNWIPGSSYKGVRLSLEGGVPLHQNLNGPQMKEDYTISAGIQFAF